MVSFLRFPEYWIERKRRTGKKRSYNFKVESKNTFSGKSDQDLYPILVIKGNNSDIKGFNGTQEYRAFYRLKFTNDTNKDETKTTSSHKIGIKEIGLIGIVLIGVSLLIIFIKTKKNNMNS